MRKQEKGFTLLEIAVCFILFAILLESLYGFFGNIYTEFIQTDTKLALNSEADMIESFLSDYIRGADKIKITIKDGADVKVIEVMQPKTVPRVATDPNNLNNDEIIDLPLVKIETERKEVDTTTSPSSYKINKSEIELTDNPTPRTGKQGEMQLNYRALPGTSGGPKLISDQIENIKVSRKKDSDLVEFTCTVHKANETNERLKVTIKFSESLAYKERLLP